MQEVSTGAEQRLDSIVQGGRGVLSVTSESWTQKDTSSLLPHVSFACDDIPPLYRSVSSVA